MVIELDKKQGLIAGNGLLPVELAKNAKENGFEVVCISLSDDNKSELKKYCSKVYDHCPGELLKTKKVLQCYAYKNTKPEAKVLEFVHKKWLPYANRKLKTIAA